MLIVNLLYVLLKLPRKSSCVSKAIAQMEFMVLIFSRGHEIIVLKIFIAKRGGKEKRSDEWDQTSLRSGVMMRWMKLWRPTLVESSQM